MSLSPICTIHLCQGGHSLNFIDSQRPKVNMEKSLDMKSFECPSPSELDKNVFEYQSLSVLESSSKMSEETSALVDPSSDRPIVRPLQCNNLTVPSAVQLEILSSTPCELTGQAKIWDMSVIEPDMNSPKPIFEVSNQDFNFSSGQEIRSKSMADISSILESGSSNPNQSAAPGGESSLSTNA